ncbi:unnamed protein product [Camellia sinensis]
MSLKSLLVLLLAVVVLTTPSLADYMKPHPHEHMAPTPSGQPPKGEKPPLPEQKPPTHHGHHPAHPPVEHGEDLHKPQRKVMPPCPTPAQKPPGHGPHKPPHKLAPPPHSI